MLRQPSHFQFCTLITELLGTVKTEELLARTGVSREGVVSEGFGTCDPHKQASERELLICQALGVRRLRFLFC